MNAMHLKIQKIQTTGELVRAAQSGDRSAFGELFERFQPTVMGLAMQRLRDHAESQELCQDVFVQAMLKIDQLRTPEAFPGWLRQIAVRMSINRAVRRAPTVAVEPEIMESTVSRDETPLDDVMEAERRTQVREGLDRLGEMDRDTLVAFYIDGHNLTQMSESFSAPLGTIKRRLHVARKRLAKQVEELAVA